MNTLEMLTYSLCVGTIQAACCTDLLQRFCYFTAKGREHALSCVPITYPELNVHKSLHTERKFGTLQNCLDNVSEQQAILTKIII